MISAVRRTFLVTGIFMAASALALAACAGDVQAPVGPGTTEDALSPAALTTTQYVLNRVDGFRLPRRVCTDGSVTLTAGSVTLRSDGAFKARYEYQTYGSTTRQVLEVSGTYQVDGGTVTFREEQRRHREGQV